MSNWDLMMPGMGLTAIGITGVTIAYSGIAHTFIDGMHALTGLTLFLGLIFLAAGILEGGVSTSNKAKATTLVILGISFSFGLAALNFNAVSTIPTFAGVMLIIAVPAIVIAYVTMKMPQYAKPVSIIFILAVGAAVASYVAFGLIGPSQYLVPPPVEEEKPAAPVSTAPVFKISILKDSSIQGNPDYDPDMAQVPAGNVIEWINNDAAAHTVTSAADAGATFDSSLISAGDTFELDTSSLEPAKYDYFCIVHPWMTASFVLGDVSEQSGERLTEDATITDPNSVIPEQTPSETLQVPAETPEEQVEEPEVQPTEEQLETEIIVSIPAGSSVPGCESTDECFIPSAVTITTGNTVTWTNDDTAAHTVTSGTDVTPDGIFDSSLLPAGKTFSFKFESSGKYPYYCMVHPWMTGRVIVE